MVAQALRLYRQLSDGTYRGNRAPSPLWCRSRVECLFKRPGKQTLIAAATSGW